MVNILASVYDSFGKEHEGVIFDGFPRTIPQAEALKKMLDERGHKIAAMIELDVPENELMVRLVKRGKESGRSDDNEETIKSASTFTTTRPLLSSNGIRRRTSITTSTDWERSTVSSVTSAP